MTKLSVAAQQYRDKTVEFVRSGRRHIGHVIDVRGPLLFIPRENGDGNYLVMPDEIVGEIERPQLEKSA